MMCSFCMDQRVAPIVLRRKKVLFLIAGVFAALICLEGVLRLVDPTQRAEYRYDQESGLITYKPNMTFFETMSCYENRVRTNNLGFHGRMVPLEKGKDVFRIVVMGSSFVEGMQIPWEKGFSALLEDQLNAMSSSSHVYEVIPIAYPGNGTYLDMVYYERFGTELKPDLVIDVTTEYEVGRNIPTAKYPPRFDEQGSVILHLPPEAQNTKISWMKNAIRKSKALMMLFSRFQVVQIRARAFLAHPTFFKEVPMPVSPSTSSTKMANDDFAREWDIEERLLKAFASRVAKDQAKFLVASWATPYASASTADTLQAKMAMLSTETPFPYLDLSPLIEQRKQTEGKVPTWTCDGHWNENGHRWVADGLFSYLTEHADLIQ